ncbi:hypothetical protein CHGG_05019 [Chaetomium globosum CBS 148.51]|uniref:Uncharacterized protein n=1 Tax=Chaetomium globosum (strain ATCC 6205 / CBS 148.51 / DSM 1962 / NBRC 6347 / NRRL 1970) TaxID=306901 RepID=Q2GZM7_CHAGB|nr:uncharacterized protein CHGG_05019 [Chaetomium globosum CBS 148.51]EAQ88400.1 hypothetical protein CHGG_05019 [Chaetomium globosum CBS 148.51]
MTSFSLPSPSYYLASTPPRHPGETSETSLDLAEVPESDRYPSIITRLVSGDPVESVYRAGVNPGPQSATHFFEEKHEKKKDSLATKDRRSSIDSHPAVMASKSPLEQGPQSPPHSEAEEARVIDSEGEDQSGNQKEDTPKRPKSPAYVAPISRIGSISPKISPRIQISATDRPELPSFVGTLLVGKLIDEDGDVIDEKTGQVLAHAAGDLPTMVGRRVTNAQGDILGDDGELLGYVADIEWPKDRPPPTAPPRSLFDVMGRATSSLMVDHAGNILDASGNVVGTFHDNNNPLHRKEKEEKEARERLAEGNRQTIRTAARRREGVNSGLLLRRRRHRRSKPRSRRNPNRTRLLVVIDRAKVPESKIDQYNASSDKAAYADLGLGGVAKRRCDWKSPWQPHGETVNEYQNGEDTRRHST